MRLRLLSLIALTALSSSAAYACGWPTSTKEDAAREEVIADVSAQTGDPASTADMIAENHVELIGLRQDLADAYAEATDSLSPESTKIVKSSQDAWTAYVENLCIAEGDREAGGSLANVLVSSCYVRETQKRVSWLRDGEDSGK